jgi:hypothetical protein
VTINIEPRRILRFLLACIALLASAGVVVVIARFGFDHGQLFGFSGRFDLHREGTVPAYFSALQLALAAVILACIARRKRLSGAAFARQWLLLCLIFAFLSLDEASELHERLREPMLAHFDLQGVWAFAWYIPYGILAVLLLLSYWRFFWALPSRIRVLFAIACACFIGCAIGLELVQVHFVMTPAYGDSAALYSALTGVAEEIGEMLGIALFVYALLLYAADEVGAMRVEFRGTAMSAPLVR